MPTSSGSVFRWVVPALGTAAAIALLFWLYRDLDIERFSSALANSNPAWLIVLGGTILLEQLIRAWKWRQFLYDIRSVSTLRLFGAVLAGYGAAVLVPLGISPLVRSWLVARLEGLRLASVLMTTAIERFLDGIVFAFFAAFVAFAAQIPEIEGNVQNGLVAAGTINLILFSGLLYILFRGRAPLQRDGARLSVWIDWLARKGGRRLDGLRAAIEEGIVWPRERRRQGGAVFASIAMKSSQHRISCGPASPSASY